jgi:uncharacterized protein YbaP (TraB family)
MRGPTPFVVAALVVTASCTSAPRCDLPPGPRGHAQPFLWHAQHAGGPMLWLYGTIHDAGAEQVPAAATTALEGTRRFVSELGDDPPDPERYLAVARLPFGAKGLDAQLSADDWFELVNAMRGVIKEADLKRARPWYAMTRLTTHAGGSPQPSMDVALARRARDHDLAVSHLESWDEQLTALDAAVTLSDLADAIHQRATIHCELARLRAAYDTGDAQLLAQTLHVRADDPLLVDRNKKWLPQLEAATDPTFVAVGLGHLLGEQGLPAMLARDGYTVERVP